MTTTWEHKSCIYTVNKNLSAKENTKFGSKSSPVLVDLS
jgi:hypothetical protein